MKDESFRLTPLDVRRTEFGTAMRGYDKASVDAFRERVADELEDLTRRNQEMEGKARGFTSSSRIRERETAIPTHRVRKQLRGSARAGRARGNHHPEARRRERRVDESSWSRAAWRRTGGADRASRAYVAGIRNLVERQSTSSTDGGGAAAGVSSRSRRAETERRLRGHALVASATAGTQNVAGAHRARIAAARAPAVGARTPAWSLRVRRATPQLQRSRAPAVRPAGCHGPLTRGSCGGRSLARASPSARRWRS